MNRITFQPKGSMCMACEHKDALCGSLHFWSMPVIETLMTDDLCNVKIVKCMSFAPARNLVADAAKRPPSIDA
jgi:hypothetical protein